MRLLLAIAVLSLLSLTATATTSHEPSISLDSIENEWWFLIWAPVFPIQHHPHLDAIKEASNKTAELRWRIFDDFGYGEYFGFGVGNNQHSANAPDPVDSLDTLAMIHDWAWHLNVESIAHDADNAAQDHCKHLSDSDLLESRSSKFLCLIIRTPAFPITAWALRRARGSWEGLIVMLVLVSLVIWSCFCVCFWFRCILRLLCFPIYVVCPWCLP